MNLNNDAKFADFILKSRNIFFWLRDMHTSAHYMHVSALYRSLHISDSKSPIWNMVAANDGKKTIMKSNDYGTCINIYIKL